MTLEFTGTHTHTHKHTHTHTQTHTHKHTLTQGRNKIRGDITDVHPECRAFPWAVTLALSHTRAAHLSSEGRCHGHAMSPGSCSKSEQ